MTPCQRCAGRATLFICGPCTTELRQLLTDLPWWIDRLTEAALGQTRLGDGSRRTRTKSSTLKGEDPAIIDDPALLRRFLAAGGVNARASDLVDQVRNTLSTWVRHICETRSIDTPELPTSAHMARWLAMNTGAIACDEGAGQCFLETANLTHAIERMINRPVPPKFCGPCPTIKERERCGLMLTAKPGAVELTCPRCKTTHNIERLEVQLLNEIDYYRFTRSELLSVMNWLGEPIPRQTMHDWIKAGKLKGRGFRRPVGPDGRVRIATNRHSEADKPVYRLADCRKLRAEKPERKVRHARDLRIE